MRKEGKWIKTNPDNNWDRRKREGNDRKRGKMIKWPGMTSYLPTENTAKPRAKSTN